MSEQDKCPQCGAEFSYSTPVGGFNNIGRYNVYMCGTRCLQGRVIEEGKDCLRRQLAQAKAENERLMKETVRDVIRELRDSRDSAVAAERARCAQIAEDSNGMPRRLEGHYEHEAWDAACQHISAAIRQGGEGAK